MGGIYTLQGLHNFWDHTNHKKLDGTLTLKEKFPKGTTRLHEETGFTFEGNLLRTGVSEKIEEAISGYYIINPCSSCENLYFVLSDVAWEKRDEGLINICHWQKLYNDSFEGEYQGYIYTSYPSENCKINYETLKNLPEDKIDIWGVGFGKAKISKK